MKLYSVNTHWKFGAISEYEVLKETEKTYVLRETGERAMSWTTTVRKSEMKSGREQFCRSLDEAMAVKKEIYEQKIKSNEERIVALGKENAELAERLEALVAGDINA